MKAGEQRKPAYLAINPLGKVPAIRHGEALVTEQVAIFVQLVNTRPAGANGSGRVSGEIRPAPCGRIV